MTVLALGDSLPDLPNGWSGSSVKTRLPLAYGEGNHDAGLSWAPATVLGTLLSF